MKDAQKFLEEVVGFRRLRVLAYERFLDQIMKYPNLEYRKRQILANLRNTFFGTMWADLGIHDTANYHDTVELPDIIRFEDVIRGEFGSSDSTLAEPGDENWNPFSLDSGETRTHGDSNIHGRALTDREIRTAYHGELVEVTSGARYVLASLDEMFSSNDFCVSRRVDRGRAFFTAEYVRKLMGGAKIPECSYVIEERSEVNKEFPSGKEEVVILKGDGYSMVFRPESRNRREFSTETEKASACSGTMIYFDLPGESVDLLKSLAAAYHTKVGIRKGDKRS